MAIELFNVHFPELGPAETRWLNLRQGFRDVPPADYACLESYCTERGCDCRRVLLNVVRRDVGVVATIGFGFDRDGEMPGPYLDLLNPQAPYAETLLELIDQLMLQDPVYVARLERHYRMMKDKTDRPHTWGDNVRQKPRPPKRPKKRKKR
jgi:hypothetical protein